MVFYIMLCKPHFHRFVAVVTTQTHHSPKYILGVVHASACCPGAAPQPTGDNCMTKSCALSDRAFLALAFGILSAKVLGEEMCPWDTQSDRLLTAPSFPACPHWRVSAPQAGSLSCSACSPPLCFQSGPSGVTFFPPEKTQTSLLP